MASVVDICNLALIEVGESRIMALTEETKTARLCDQFYEATRDMLLRTSPWNFATKRVELAMLSTAPSFGFDNAFSLPTDCLKVQRTEDIRDVYKVEGRSILINRVDCKIIYTARIEDPTQFDSLFVEALYLKMASKISWNLSDNNGLSQTLEAKAQAVLRGAKSMDGQEGITDTVEADLWLASRF